MKDDIERILMRDTGTDKDKKEDKERNKERDTENKEHEMAPKNFIHG